MLSGCLHISNTQQMRLAYCKIVQNAQKLVGGGGEKSI